MREQGEWGRKGRTAKRYIMEQIVAGNNWDSVPLVDSEGPCRMPQNCLIKELESGLFTKKLWFHIIWEVSLWLLALLHLLSTYCASTQWPSKTSEKTLRQKSREMSYLRRVTGNSLNCLLQPYWNQMDWVVCNLGHYKHLLYWNL